MKFILVQIYRFEQEQWLLRKMAETFLRNGYRMVLWTNREYGTAGLPTVPLSRGEEDDILYLMDGSKIDDWPDLSLWKNFEKQFQERYGKTESAYDSIRGHQISSILFDSLRPSLFLCWSGMDPWYAIPKAIAKKRGIPVLTWEAGMLPQTLLLDRNGICAESQWTAKPIPPVSDQSFVKAETYIENWKTRILNAVENKDEKQSPLTSKKLLILGGLDSANGVMHAPMAWKETLPGFADGIDLAIQAAERHCGDTIYRPHPNEPALPLKRLNQSKVSLDKSISLLEAIQKADIVIGYGSKTDFLAMALGKPYITAGIGLLTGKGCAYTATAPEELADAIAEASKYGRTEQQQKMFCSLVAWMLEETHYNRISTGPCDKGVVGFVQDALLHAKRIDENGDFAAILSGKGRKWLKDSHTQFRFEKRCAIDLNNISELENKIDKLPSNYCPILDFDHTLFLGNSTERFLLNVYPRLWGEVIDKSVRYVWRLCGRRQDYEIDRWRVLAAVIFAPWSLLWWKLLAQKEVKLRWNLALENAATVGRSTGTVIVSLGFSQLIGPLVTARYKNYSAEDRPKLVCSDLFNHSTSLRKLGKVQALESNLKNLNWLESFAVSDSYEDRALLEKCHKGYYLQWNEPTSYRHPGYMPFRFLERAKFKGRGYLKHNIIEQDLIVWMFAYGLVISHSFPALLFFLSLHSIYEIGYYENDYLSAKMEKSPTLFFDLNDYKYYSIRIGAWSFGLLSGTLGVFMLSGGWNAFLVVKWALLLALLRITFFVYNRQSTGNRLPLYVILQAIKNFGGVVVMALNPVGLALALGHAFQHTSVYQIYRCSGDKAKFPRSLMRSVVFLIAVSVSFSVGTYVNYVWVIVALTWCIYQLYLEKRGHKYSILNIVKSAFRVISFNVFPKFKR